VFLKKYPNNELDKIVAEGQREKEQRARVLFEELKAKSLEGVAALKSDVTSFVGDNYPFKETEPKAVFHSLVGIFTGYKALEPPHENTTAESYVAYATFVHQDGLTIKNVIEAHVIASGHSGNVQVGVYSREPGDSRVMLDILYKKITGLQFGLKQRAESAESKCPNCGANLPLDKADAEGYVKCESCKQRAILPKRLRH
jgi:DNA-directed RNA polymerase subunit RPC12/RpoP